MMTFNETICTQHGGASPWILYFTIVHKLNSIKKSNEIDERHRKTNEHLT